MENTIEQKETKERLLILTNSRGEVKTRRVVSVMAHVVICGEENLSIVKEIINSNPNAQITASMPDESGESPREYQVTITGKFLNDKDFADFYWAMYTGDLGESFADIEDISWTEENAPEDPNAFTTVILGDELWRDLETLVDSGTFNSLPDLVLNALNNQVTKCHEEAR